MWARRRRTARALMTPCRPVALQRPSQVSSTSSCSSVRRGGGHCQKNGARCALRLRAARDERVTARIWRCMAAWTQALNSGLEQLHVALESPSLADEPFFDMPARGQSTPPIPSGSLSATPSRAMEQRWPAQSQRTAPRAAQRALLNARAGRGPRYRCGNSTSRANPLAARGPETRPTRLVRAGKPSMPPSAPRRQSAT